MWGDPKLLQRLFAAESIETKRNTEAIETSPNQLISARIIQYKPSVILPLPEVKNMVVQALLKQKALELAKADGKLKLEAWREKPDSAQLQAPVFVSREQTQNLPAALIDIALRANASKLPTLEGVDLGAKGFGVVKVTKIKDAVIEKPTTETVERFTKSWATAENLAYFSLLKDRLKASVKTQAPADNRIMR